jgi:hypothetical protein
MEENMQNLSEFSHNHHPSGVKMLAKYIRREISVLHSEGSPNLIEQWRREYN